MHSTLAAFHFFGHPVILTLWKIIGYCGSLIFGGRWVVQVIASRYLRRPVVPALFWYMSVVGNLMLVAYFIFGKNDSVGILSNAFPTLVACYNIYLEKTHHRSLRESAGV